MKTDIVAAAQARAYRGELTCEDAHALADELGLSPGELADALSQGSGLRFSRCQLGLFGYGNKAAG